MCGVYTFLPQSHCCNSNLLLRCRLQTCVTLTLCQLCIANRGAVWSETWHETVNRSDYRNPGLLQQNRAQARERVGCGGTMCRMELLIFLVFTPHTHTHTRSTHIIYSFISSCATTFPTRSTATHCSDSEYTQGPWSGATFQWRPHCRNVSWVNDIWQCWQCILCHN